MQTIQTPDAPPPAGHYSQAMAHNGTIYISGQMPVDPRRPEAPLGTVEEQTEQVLRNIAEILAEAGSGLDRLLQVTVFLSDVSLWDRMNTAYARVMGDHRPARVIVPTSELRRDAQIAMSAIAAGPA